MAKWLIIIGLGIAALGVLIWLLQKVGLPLGHLPGDIRVEREGGSFYFPVVTCVVVSIVLTVLLNLVFRFFR